MLPRCFRTVFRSDPGGARPISGPYPKAVLALGLVLSVLILAAAATPLLAGNTLTPTNQRVAQPGTLTTTPSQVARAQADPDAAEHYVGWVVGQSDSGYGAIFRSVDGGATWERQGTPATIPDVILGSVAALDPLTCWVVGESSGGYGTILRTEDGGATWERQGSPTTIPDAGLAKISAVDRNTAWVVGTPGTILFTDDGGATWTQKQTADIPPVLLQGVYALDADNVWVTGDTYGGYGTIFRTQDGGMSWQRKGSPAEVPDAALLDVHASDADTAWIASSGAGGKASASVIHTDDNGASWTGQILVAFFDTNSLTTIGDNIVWVVTDADGIYRTDNARDFLQQQAAHGKYDYYLVCINALDADTAWATGPAGGRSTPAGIVMHTSDSGKTWVNQLELDIALQAVSFVRPSTFYFAEGTTRPGFEPYMCIANPGAEAAEVTIDYVVSGTAFEQRFTIPPSSRVTVPVSSFLGIADGAVYDFGAEVICTNGRIITPERSMYFDYTGGGSSWTGGSCVVGTASPSNTWYFAEGCTRPGFDEYTCVLNLGDVDADLTFRFHTQEEGEKTVQGISVPAHSRGTFSVNGLLGDGYQTSLALESTQPVVAERSMYFDYAGAGEPSHWNGGHCVMGETSLATRYYFAEGCTRDGFDEYLTIQNPGDAPITVDAVYSFAAGQGEAVERSYSVEQGRRATVFVADEVGEGKDVSVELTSAAPFMAERPIYFDYAGMGAPGWTGGSCVMGAAETSEEWLFAEGCTHDGFQEWLILLNPEESDATVEITYFTQEEGALPVRTVTVPSHKRVNLYVNDSAGPGYQLSARLWVVSGPGIVAERPMYFSYGTQGWTGGHCVVGYAP